MSSSSKCSQIRHIVRLRQMLRRWRNKARASANRAPSDVPAGHVAVCVGSNFTRFVVRATYLNHPVFKKLLLQAEEEYGFSNHGPLAIPCDETLFQDILRFISRSGPPKSNRLLNLEIDDFRRHCHLDFWPESRPLLHGPTDNTIWVGLVDGVLYNKKNRNKEWFRKMSIQEMAKGGKVVPGSDRRVEAVISWLFSS